MLPILRAGREPTLRIVFATVPNVQSASPKHE
jgi:hypothetical protein